MEQIDVLDFGYVKFIESWGSDERVVEAARMSTGKGFKGWSCWQCVECGLELENRQPHTSQPGVFCDNETNFERIPRDEKLLKYLWDNKHATPFEMAGAVVEVQAPILVFRQWHRHRTQSYNEMSARYAPLPDFNYVPTVERLMQAARKDPAHPQNKQAGTAKGAPELTEANAEIFREKLLKMYEQQQELYTLALGAGIPMELARVHLGVGRYSRMRASANLRNWLAFLALRDDEHAQLETRVFAQATSQLIRMRFPRTHELFTNSKLAEHIRAQEAR